MSKPAPTRYRTLNWSGHDAALRRRGSLAVRFDPSTPWHAAPSGKRGAQPVYGDAAIQACLTTARQGITRRCPERDQGPLRGAASADDRSAGLTVASLLRLAGPSWPVPDYSTPCRRRKTLAVRLPCRGSGGPLHLLVPSWDIAARCPAG